ncbi:hypothetical protein GmHk_08G023471 [Glycine max]|nr:hypothetical protein GmHk_08G023471 [Glycine max]
MAAGTRNGDCIPEGTNKSSEEISTHGRKRHHGDAEDGRKENGPMNLLTYNATGLGRGVKWLTIRRMVRNQKVDVLCIQETKKEVMERHMCQALWGDSEVKWVAQPAVNTAGGILCVWSEKTFKLEKKETGNGFIMLVGKWIPEDQIVHIINIYSPCDIQSKRVLWESVKQLKIQNQGGLWCVLGDFNSIIIYSERFGACHRGSVDAGSREFNEWIKEMEVEEAPWVGSKFTWEMMIKKQLQEDLWMAAQSHESLLRQKARSRWIKEGDCNSRYFHLMINATRRNNCLKGLMVDGAWTDDPTTVKEAVRVFFEQHFKENEKDRPTLDGVAFKTIDNQQNDTLVRDRLPTRVNLNRRQIQVGELTCPFCGGEEESAGHLFLQCGKIISVWWESLSWVGLSGVFPNHPRQHFIQHIHGMVEGVRSSKWKRWWLALTWSIWQQRNNIIFSNGSFDANRILDNAVFLLWTWLTNLEKDFNMHFNYWSSNIRAAFLNRGG